MKFLLVTWACIFLKVALSQNICSCQKPLTDSISSSNPESTCKNLALAIQNVVMSNLRKNAAKRPIFRKIAPPLLDEIVKNLNCQCPACKMYKVSSNPPSNALTNLITTPCDNYNSLLPTTTINSLLNSATNAIGKANIFTNTVANSLNTISLPCSCNGACSCSNTNSLANSLNSLLTCGCNGACSCSNVLKSEIPVVNFNTPILPCGCQNGCGCSLLSTPSSCSCQKSLKVLSTPSTCGCKNSLNVLNAPSNTFVGMLDSKGNILSNSVISGSLSGSSYSDIFSLLSNLSKNSCACRS